MISIFIRSEIIIQIGSKYYWLLFCIVPLHNSCPGIHISKEGNMLLLKNSLHCKLLIMKNTC